MEREGFSNDQVDQVLGHLFSGLAVFYAEICEWLIDADLSQRFLADGARTLPEWVSARFGLRHSTAAQLVRVARRLQDLPRLREMFATGELSLDQTDAISKLVSPETEEAVIEECLGLSNAALDRAARRANPPSTAEEREAWRERWLSIQYTLDGIRAHMNADLPGVEMSLVESAIRERADRMPPNPDSGIFDPYPQRMADGLVELSTTTGDEHASGPTQIVVHADLDALIESSETGVAEVQGGPVIANETARRLSCDPLVECAVYDHTKVLGIGRRSRLIPAWLRHQLWHRDGGCQFPGCGTRNFVQAHHRTHWADGGPTDLDNLILLCGYHHRFLHEHGWVIEDDGCRKHVFRRSDGQIYPPIRPRLDPRLRVLVGQRT
ncbi:MAG TPA: DUF222 domain-containing protein [Acidimicrobiia bacterium]|jgi:hypothetical protein|nr:DUF222 domain-containing protein [Acidimicrobiia bacterium]